MLRGLIINGTFAKANFVTHWPRHRPYETINSGPQLTRDCTVTERQTIDDAMDRLVQTLRGYGRVAVALSGGVDSSVVAKASALALGDRAVAVSGNSASVAAAELETAREIARHIGIRHVVVDTTEFEDSDYIANDGTRCYHCKSELYDQVERLRSQLGFDVICSGANLDDMGDYRPGLRAAAERGVRHPLQEAAFTKEMVRLAARKWGLPNWDKPAAPCLSSRIAVGVEATPERTRRVEDAEALLRELGFRECRVRYHAGDLARIEVPATEISRFLDPQVREGVATRFRAIGFQFISLDLEGFRSGSLNVLIPPDLLKMPRKHDDSPSIH